jgi:succinyl-CoA synthetase beta subunit
VYRHVDYEPLHGPTARRHYAGLVRLEGNNVVAGKETLDQSGLKLVSGDTMADAAQKIVKLVAA